MAPLNDPDRPNDHTDYDRRRRVNIAVGVGLSVLLFVFIWAVQALEENERLQRCLATGRRDCIKVADPGREGPLAPTLPR